MAFTSAEVSVGTTATLIHTGAAVDVRVRATSNDPVYVGPSTVTVATGFPLWGELSYTSAVGDDLYGIVPSGEVNVRVLTQP